MFTPPFPWSIFWWAALLIPPWNIFWWIIGFSIYKLMGGKNDLSGDSAQLLIFAPAVLPMGLVVLLKVGVEEVRYKRKKKLFFRTARWIGRALGEKGILVSKVATSCYGCVVEAEVADDTQILDYRKIYARAIKKFPKLSSKEICHNAKPLEYLDQGWAEMVGIKEYAAEDWSAPCVKCGEKKSLGIQWGNRELHERPWWYDSVNYLHFKDGTKETVLGYICRECLWKIPFTHVCCGGTIIHKA